MVFDATLYAGFRDRFAELWDLTWGAADTNPYGSRRETQRVSGEQLTEVSYNSGLAAGNLLAVRWEAVHGLQFVSLRLMHDQAVQSGVPFSPLEGSIAGTDVSMDETLTDYYDDIRTAPHEPRATDEVAIRRIYAHVSCDDDLLGAHVPRPSGRRAVDRM